MRADGGGGARVEWLLEGRVAPPVVLVAAIAAGVVVYVPSALLLVPDALAEIKAAIRKRRQPRGSRSASPSSDSTSGPGS